MKRLNDQVIKIADENNKIYPNDAGFVEAVNEAWSLLEDLPKTFEFEFHLKLKPEKLGKNPSETILNLTRNLYGWIGYFIYNNAYKVHQILEAYIDALNAFSYTSTMILARSLMEYAATINYYAEQLSLKISKLDESRNQGSVVETVKYMIELIQICHKYSKLTRINWHAYMRGDLDSFFKDWSYVDPKDKQINILTLVDKLPQKEKGARFFYDMLSDFAHPNLASQILVIDEARLIDENKAKYTLSKYTKSEELLGVVIHCMAIPTRNSLKIISGWIKTLRQAHNNILKWIEYGEGLLHKDDKIQDL
jgi:hypothetical protein